MARWHVIGITATGAGLLAMTAFLLLRPGPGPGGGGVRRAPEKSTPFVEKPDGASPDPQKGAPHKDGVHIPSGEPTDIRRKRATCIKGRVFIGDREHHLRDTPLRMRVGRKHAWSRTDATTGSEGKFTAEPLFSGEWVTFTLPPYRPVTIEIPVTEEVPAVAVEVIFQEGIRVRGRILGIGGEPIPDLRIEWEREGALGTEGDSCRTDLQGRFEMTGLYPGRHSIAIATFLGEKRKETISADPPVQGLEITLDLLLVFEIRVEDSGGKPLPDTEVYCNYRHGLRCMNKWSGKTNGHGTLRLKGIPAQGTLTAHTKQIGVASAVASTDLSSDRGPLVLRLILKTQEPVERFLKIDPENAGVRLRRTIDQSMGPQRAEVTVDGAPAGVWYDPDRNPWKCLAESDLELTPALVKGKSSIRVGFKPRDGIWSIGELRVFSHVDRPLGESTGKGR